MSRRQNRSELPQFDNYDEDVAAATAQGVYQDPLTPQTYGEGFVTSAVTTPEALEAAKRAAYATMRRQANAQHELYRTILAPQVGYSQPGQPHQPRSQQQIESAYRDAIAGRPTPRAIGPAPAGPRPTPGSKAPQNNGSAARSTEQALASQTPSTGEVKSKTLMERFREKPVQWTGGVLLTASVLYLGSRASMSDGASAAALTGQSAAKELKNDTFACPTPVAQVQFKTGPNMEVHIPVQLKTPGHENSYVSIPLGQLNVKMILNACGVTDPTKGSRTWAKLNGDKQYVINRDALKLSVDPWAKTFNNNNGLTEDQARANIAGSILPAPDKGLTLMVDGKPASIKEYPLADNTPEIVMTSAKSKSPDMYSPVFVEEFVDKLQEQTIKTLENPNFCSSVLPTVDAANIAALRQQKNLDAKTQVIFNDKTSYGKASTVFENENVTKRDQPVWKSGKIKEVLNSNVVEIENFNMSCAAIAYTQAKLATAPPAKSKATSTTPATKK